MKPQILINDYTSIERINAIADEIIQATDNGDFALAQRIAKNLHIDERIDVRNRIQTLRELKSKSL